MKFCNYEENTGEIKGYYDDEIHQVIPEPNIEITEENWKKALSENHNKINADGTTELVDFRTTEEILYNESLPNSEEIEKMEYQSKLIENLMELGVM